jgi:4'-phosphopantetheinyl transferase
MALDVDAGHLESFAALLTADEYGHAARFRLARNRSRYVVRRGRLRQLLADRLRCDPREVILSYNDFGKPVVASANLRFSVSHSHGLALYVIADGLDIGCDIEWRVPEFASLEAAELFFSPIEVETLKALPADRRHEAFFNCWTRKEAFVKALGLGLSYPLDAFDVSLTPGAPASFLRGADGWRLHAFEPFAGLHVAVTGRGEGWTLVQCATLLSCRAAAGRAARSLLAA